MDRELRSKARFVAGDPLRAIAAFGVLLGHVFVSALAASGNADLIGQPLPGIDWLKRLADAGPQLIYLFFALSGYVLGRPFVKAFVDGTSYPSLGRYAKNRLLRIVPAYWLVLTICLVVISLPSKPARPVVEAYLFSLDWYRSPIEGILPQAWTLRVEMRFYLLLPVVAAIAIWMTRAAGRSVGRTARCWVVIAVAAAWGIGMNVITRGAGAYVSGAGLRHTAFAFAPGVMMAGVELLPMRATVLRRPLVAWLAGASVLFAVSLWVYPWWTVLTAGVIQFQFRAMILVTLFLGGLLFWQWSDRRTWRVLDNPVLRWAGSRSYGIYLLHLFVLTRLVNELAQPGSYKRTFAVVLPATLALTCLAAEVLYRLVEKPALDLKDVPLRTWLKPVRRPRSRSSSASGHERPLVPFGDDTLR